MPPSEQYIEHHISSAVVTAHPAKAAVVRRVLEGMPGVEVHACQATRIVITIEGPDSGSLGGTLVQIALLDGVITANMVFEQKA